MLIGHIYSPLEATLGGLWSGALSPEVIGVPGHNPPLAKLLTEPPAEEGGTTCRTHASSLL